ncbi:uncharacterized protein LOC118450998 isoform X3 [Vespa mandarinia]|uniref:uncharacterized protein LOC118450998 isoform X3 n=1 Tax=Vespa mandarinia TaxID=7446 RepID=UPI00161F3C46|nr:uncharacterized protein LOC118450998 isoform X3 [Vespa mandarinia]
MTHTSRYLGYHGSMNRDYLTDEEESQRAPSDRTMSEYIVANDHTTMMKPVIPTRKNRKEKYDQGEERRSQSAQNGHGSVLSGPSRYPFNKSASHGSICDNGSDIYVTSAAYRTTSEISRGSHHSLAPSSRMDHRASSHYSYGSGRSGISTVKTQTSRKDVIQFFQPLIVWILGIVFLVFGFLTLIGSLVYCVHVFRNANHPHDINPEDLYWTRYWQKQVGSAPEVFYKAEDKYQEDGYSDHYSKYSACMTSTTGMEKI